MKHRDRKNQKVSKDKDGQLQVKSNPKGRLRKLPLNNQN